MSPKIEQISPILNARQEIKHKIGHSDRMSWARSNYIPQSFITAGNGWVGGGRGDQRNCRVTPGGRGGGLV